MLVREHMRPLVAIGLLFVAIGLAPGTAIALPWPLQAFQSTQTTTTTITTTTTSSSGDQPHSSSLQLLRLKASRLRRPEWCRESLPRKPDDLPALVAIGRVREVYLSDPATGASGNETGADPRNNRALVTLSRVLVGKRDLLNTDIIIAGFNSSQPAHSQCPNFVKPNDTLILLLQPDPDNEPRKYFIQASNLLSMSLENLDKINTLVASTPDDVPKRRGMIEDILCEAHYCTYGRCKIVDADQNQVRCECPDSCTPSTSVCGSDNSTYPSECHLIREGCARRRPLFVTHEGAC